MPELNKHGPVLYCDLGVPLIPVIHGFQQASLRILNDDYCCGQMAWNHTWEAEHWPGEERPRCAQCVEHHRGLQAALDHSEQVLARAAPCPARDDSHHCAAHTHCPVVRGLGGTSGVLLDEEG